MTMPAAIRKRKRGLHATHVGLDAPLSPSAPVVKHSPLGLKRVKKRTATNAALTEDHSVSLNVFSTNPVGQAGEKVPIQDAADLLPPKAVELPRDNSQAIYDYYILKFENGEPIRLCPHAVSTQDYLLYKARPPPEKVEKADRYLDEETLILLRSPPAALRNYSRRNKDHSDLRGFSYPVTITSGLSSSIESIDMLGQKIVQGSKRSSVYTDPNWGADMVALNVYPNDYPHEDEKKSASYQPLNLKDIISLVKKPRDEQVLPETWKQFSRKCKTTVTETGPDGVAKTCFPYLRGPLPTTNSWSEDQLFDNLAPLTTKEVVRLKPDYCEGTSLLLINKRVALDLRKLIVPYERCQQDSQEQEPREIDADEIGAPNFFVEIKGPDGKAQVAGLQAMHDGAHGARVMSSLQNYGKKEPQYDNKARAISCCFHAGIYVEATLTFYAHNITEPEPTSGGRPLYHMHRICKFEFSGYEESSRAFEAFQNARDLAKAWREEVIEIANKADTDGPDVSSTSKATPLTDVDKDRQRKRQKLKDDKARKEKRMSNAELRQMLPPERPRRASGEGKSYGPK